MFKSLFNVLVSTSLVWVNIGIIVANQISAGKLFRSSEIRGQDSKSLLNTKSPVRLWEEPEIHPELI